MQLQSVGGLLESAAGLSEQSQSAANIPHNRQFTVSRLWDVSKKTDNQHPSPLSTLAPVCSMLKPTRSCDTNLHNDAAQITAALFIYL